MSERIDLRRITSVLRTVPIFPTVVLAIFLVCGVFGGFFVPHDPNDMELNNSLMPPFWEEGGSTSYLLGTDQLGRDMLSRVIGGAGISLQVGFVVVFISGTIGSIFALLSGYLGGWVDVIIMRMADTFLALPYMLIAIAMAAILGPSRNNIILILVIMGWAGYARVLRSEVLRIKEVNFIQLAIVAGCSNVRIMLRHIFPNIVNTLTIMATLQFGSVIIAESSLSFLGLGVPPPHPAWGSMLADGRNHMTNAWWMSVWPGVAILLVVLSCNLLGDWLRVRLDPKFRQL